MKFKPNLRKTIVSIVVIIIWYCFNIFSIIKLCAGAGACLPCAQYNLPSLFPNCCGCGIEISQLFLQIIYILIPGIIVYIVWSFIQKDKKLKKESEKKLKKKRGRK